MDYLRTAKNPSNALEFVCRSIRARLLIILTISAHGCIMRTGTDIPNNDFVLPTLDYLRAQANTLEHRYTRCFMFIFFKK